MADLKVAVPNKGALSEATVALLKDAGYKCVRSGRELVVADAENRIEFLFLRPRDIAVYVGKGIIELGITGRDLMLDSRADVKEIMALNFGRSSFFYAVTKGSELTPDKLDGLRIATSYPNIVEDDLKKRGAKASIVRLDGAVEISIRLGVADVIADVVESGGTLKEAGLEVTGEPLLKSEAVLIARTEAMAERPEIQTLLGRIRGIMVARSWAMVEYDIPRTKLELACKVTPGIEAPTIAPLSNPDWVAVKAMVKRATCNRIMDELYELGARGIIVTDLRSCRL
ncbi:MAG: ATP phosphoribosyltransferase [Victivallaceae bacterium]|jgi:ATP phosphoribosyltransferase|nr:ATP phosphoribosyltransferase [Victivallaceae bacterium]NLK84254.1 ATP phosphoribosyltransferase [Lentisphaerota bacterium]MDD3117301.1 ATP phosphoribosyltransferase [Victivallaceae bacterium]MDD3703905.1 ATP phosphoribosyltransferase [Victivallaceae bacterium]MDD4318588.1 ATP phosphoribosyltransferase [Victivallaceae bacterium]